VKIVFWNIQSYLASVKFNYLKKCDLLSLSENGVCVPLTCSDANPCPQVGSIHQGSLVGRCVDGRCDYPSVLMAP